MLSLLLAGLASPATATAEREEELAALEWDLGLAPSGGGAFERGFFGRLSRAALRAAVTPGAVRARFGLGLDTFFEHQESLRIVSMESAVTARDLVGGGEENGFLHGDPGLLNRKFDISWEMEGAGVEFPIVLPRLGRYASPTLFLQAATADVTLDFVDRTRAGDSGSLEGGATLLGAELSVVTALCQSCPLYAETSYGVRKLPSFTVDRSPRFGPEGFEVLEDEVRLGREVQEIATRIGYSFSGNRATAYTGVLHRWTDLEIEDELRYRDPLGATETHLTSRTELESEATLAVAGVNYRRGQRLSGRFETSAGGGDWGVTFKLVYFPGARDEPPDFKSLAASAAPLLKQLEAEFRERRQRLVVVSTQEGDPAYRAADVEELLDWTEDGLFEILHHRALAPLRDSIRLRFRGFRKELGSNDLTERGERRTSGARPMLAFAALRVAQAPRKVLPQSEGIPLLKAVGDLLLMLTGLADDGRFTLRVCVDSLPRGAQFQMWPPEDPNGTYPSKRTMLEEKEAVRGLYVYKVWGKDRSAREPDMRCPDSKHPPGPDEPDEVCLDLLDKTENQLLVCNLKKPRCELPRTMLPHEKCPSR